MLTQLGALCEEVTKLKVRHDVPNSGQSLIGEL